MRMSRISLIMFSMRSLSAAICCFTMSSPSTTSTSSLSSSTTGSPPESDWLRTATRPSTQATLLLPSSWVTRKSVPLTAAIAVGVLTVYESSFVSFCFTLEKALPFSTTNTDSSPFVLILVISFSTLTTVLPSTFMAFSPKYISEIDLSPSVLIFIPSFTTSPAAASASLPSACTSSTLPLMKFTYPSLARVRSLSFLQDTWVISSMEMPATASIDTYFFMYTSSCYGLEINMVGSS